ncbi:unnamed protein product, partial [Discosporangium mesarthrocarpum]
RRFGDILRQSGVGVKDFMQHVTLLSQRLPKEGWETFNTELRLMKEGIVVTKMVHGKYRQLWDWWIALPPSDAACLTIEARGGAADAGKEAPSSLSSPSSPSSLSSPFPPTPPALLDLGWYIYLLAKERMGIPSSNASFLRCFQLMVATLGTVLLHSVTWRVLAGAGAEAGARAQAQAEAGAGVGAEKRVEGKVVAGEVAGAGMGGKGFALTSKLLDALSREGKCSPAGVKAFEAPLAGVIQTLMEEWVLRGVG